MTRFATALICLLLVACSAPIPLPASASPASPASLPGLGLHFSNGTTTLIATLVVNGQSLQTVPPGADTEISITNLPPAPWTAEAHSPSGRLLVALSGSGMLADGSTFQFVDLSCGRLWIWLGSVVPDAPVPPSPGKPGDCAR